MCCIKSYSSVAKIKIPTLVLSTASTHPMKTVEDTPKFKDFLQWNTSSTGAMFRSPFPDVPHQTQCPIIPNLVQYGWWLNKILVLHLSTHISKLAFSMKIQSRILHVMINVEDKAINSWTTSGKMSFGILIFREHTKINSHYLVFSRTSFFPNTDDKWTVQ